MQAEVQPRCGRGAAEVRPKCSRGAAEVQPRCGRGAAGAWPGCAWASERRDTAVARGADEKKMLSAPSDGPGHSWRKCLGSV